MSKRNKKIKETLDRGYRDTINEVKVLKALSTLGNQTW